MSAVRVFAAQGFLRCFRDGSLGTEQVTIARKSHVYGAWCRVWKPIAAHWRVFRKMAIFLNISYHPGMGQIAEKERLVRDVVALRAVEADLPAAVERLGPVRASLERTIGRTVSRAMAARPLGVSQTALDRWVESGDVPAVMTRSGRQEIPLHVLVGLVERVDQLRQGGDLHALASALNAERRRAEELDLGRILPHFRSDRDRSGHRRAELLSLAYHRAIAERLDDQTVQEARRRLHDGASSSGLPPAMRPDGRSFSRSRGVRSRT